MRVSHIFSFLVHICMHFLEVVGCIYVIRSLYLVPSVTKNTIGKSSTSRRDAFFFWRIPPFFRWLHQNLGGTTENHDGSTDNFCGFCMRVMCVHREIKSHSQNIQRVILGIF